MGIEESEQARRYAAAVRMVGGPEKFNQIEYEHKGHVNSEERWPYPKN